MALEYMVKLDTMNGRFSLAVKTLNDPQWRHFDSFQKVCDEIATGFAETLENSIRSSEEKIDQYKKLSEGIPLKQISV